MSCLRVVPPVVAATVFLTAAAAGADALWTATGPACERVLAIAEGPAGSDALYLISGPLDRGRLYGSDDLGRGWREIGPDLRDPEFFIALAAHPERPGTLFAGHLLRGLLRTDDGGESWRSVTGGLPQNAVLQVAISAARPDQMFALATLTSGVDAGRLFRSTDGGASWQDVSPAREIELFALHPSFPDVLLASSRVRGLFGSDDGGRRWRRARSGLNAARVDALAFDPDDAGAAYASAGAELFTTDNRRAWRALGPAPAFVTSLDVDPRGSGNLLAGLFHFDQRAGLVRSGNGGGRWRFSNGVDELVLTLVRSRHRSNTVYAGTAAGFARLNGRGKHYREHESGLATAPAGRLAVAGDATRGVYATSGCLSRGIFFTAGEGPLWSHTEQRATVLAVAPAAPELVYAALGSSLAISADGARSWSTLDLTDLIGPGSGIEDLEIAPSDPDRLYAAALGDGVLASDDAGLGWRGVADTGLAEVLAVAVDRADPAVLWAVGEGGIARSADGGVSFELLVAGLGGSSTVYDVRVDPRRGRTLYALCAPAGGRTCLYESSDRGATWSSLGDRLPRVLRAFAVDPVRRGTLYAATGKGVLRSTDGGTTWSDFDTGLEGSFVQDLAVAPDGSTLWAATLRGVYSTPLDR